MQSEESGDGHSPPCPETCSPGKLFDIYMLRNQFWCILTAQILEQYRYTLFSTVLDFRDCNGVAFQAT